jgi:predicted RNase H-like HicB family nuclease
VAGPSLPAKARFRVIVLGRPLMHRYEVVIFWSAEDRVFVAEMPELAGCVAHGKTPAKALAEGQQAISLWLCTAREFGDPIPEPKGRRLQYA